MIVMIVSNRTHFMDPPQVSQSKVPGSGEGLFAKVDIEPNTIIAFYNGKRIKPRSPVSHFLEHLF